MGRSVQPLLDVDLYTRRIRVRARDVVYIKGVFEAWEGLGALFGEGGNELVIATPHSQRQELDEVLDDLLHELDERAT